MVKWKRERKRRSYLDSYFLAQVLLTVQSFVSSVYISLGHDMQHKNRNLLRCTRTCILLFEDRKKTVSFLQAESNRKYP